MGVRKEEYIVIGCKLGRKFTKALFKKSDEDWEAFESNSWNKKKPKQIGYIVDGMSGEYTFFGFIKQLSDGWEDMNTEIIVFEEPTDEKRKEVEEKFKEMFPDEEMPPIKMYYLPHYT